MGLIVVLGGGYGDGGDGCGGGGGGGGCVEFGRLAADVFFPFPLLFYEYS